MIKSHWGGRWEDKKADRGESEKREEEMRKRKGKGKRWRERRWIRGR
jgi:hypothetical protein